MLVQHATCHDLPHVFSQVRFFERVKLERRIKQLERQLQQARERGLAVAASETERLARLQDDLQVCPACTWPCICRGLQCVIVHYIHLAHYSQAGPAMQISSCTAEVGHP